MSREISNPDLLATEQLLGKDELAELKDIGARIMQVSVRLGISPIEASCRAVYAYFEAEDTSMRDEEK